MPYGYSKKAALKELVVTANLRCFSEGGVDRIQMEFSQSVSQLQLNQTFVWIDRLNGSGDETVTSGNGPDQKVRSDVGQVCRNERMT